MVTARAASSGWSPWSQRFYAALPLPTLWVGVGLALASFAVLVTIAWFSGDLAYLLDSDRSLLDERDARIAIILCLLMGFLPTAQRQLLQFTRDNLAVLKPAGPEEAAGLVLPRPSFWLCTLPGILLMPIVAFSVDRDPALYFSARYWANVMHFFQWPFGVLVTLNTALLAHLSLACARAVGERAGELLEIDLLDLRPLAPFARQSQLTALTWILMSSIFALNAVDAEFTVPILLIGAICVVLIAVSFAICHRALHQRIREEKERETARVNQALRGDRDAASRLLVGGDASRQLGVADLLAYRSFVGEVNEWAFDAAAWLRILLYLAIPVGSWLGGALVERIVDASLS